MTYSREEVVQEVCRGNVSASQFALAFIEWFHWVDDVTDQDKLWLPEQVVRVNLRAVLAFSENEFFQRNKLCLMPLVIQAARAYGDSIKWAQRARVEDRRAADVVKSFYHEILWHIAYLCGGWGHMTQCTEKFRHFDYDYRD